MDEFGNGIADDSPEMVSEGMTNASTELRKRRSTRIVQAVPLVVTGVDALGRPFMERTSSLIISRFRMAPSSDGLSMKFVAIAAAVILFAGWAPTAEAHGGRHGSPPMVTGGGVLLAAGGGMATMPTPRLLPRIAKDY